MSHGLCKKAPRIVSILAQGPWPSQPWPTGLWPAMARRRLASRRRGWHLHDLRDETNSTVGVVHQKSWLVMADRVQQHRAAARPGNERGNDTNAQERVEHEHHWVEESRFLYLDRMDKSRRWEFDSEGGVTVYMGFLWSGSSIPAMEVAAQGGKRRKGR